MTEAEWLACAELGPMLESLQGKASARKSRLFACACCRRVWHLLTDERSRAAVETAERFADGLADEDELVDAWDGAIEANDPNAPDVANAAVTAAGLSEPVPHRLAGEAAFEAADAVAYPAFRAAADAALGAYEPGPDGYHTDDECEAARKVAHAAHAAVFAVEEAEQAKLLRCVFGNPFRPLAVRPDWLAWNDGAVPKLAAAIYEERAFDRLPVLADALEEAGCTDGDLLGHCRRPGEHARGCWAVDLLLGKS
jgi:hypothetical protein